MEDNKVSSYNRYLSPLDVWAIAFGCSIGWGAFMLPGSTFLPAAGPLGTLAAMAISVAVMLIIGANFSFMMQHKPGTGGVYAYTKTALDRNHAFLCAWFLSLSYLSILFLNAASLFTVIRTVFGSSLQIGYAYYNIGGHLIFMGEVGASIVALACVGLLFINAKPFLQRLQTILAFVLLAGVVIAAVFCLPHLRIPGDGYGIQGNSPNFAVFSVVMLAPLCFFGFEVVSLETAHFDFKERLSRRILTAAILLSGIVCCSLTLVSVCAVPDGYASWQAFIADLDQLSGLQSVPAFFSVKAIMGDFGLWIIAVAALAAILTVMIAAYRATTRVLSTMAEDHILSERFSKTNYSILFIMLVSILISIFGSNMLESFLKLSAVGAVIGFGYTSFAAWKLARKMGKTLFMATGIAGTVASVVFAAVNLIPSLTAMEMLNAEAYLFLSIWCLIGLMFYLRTVVHSGEVSSAYSCVVMFALLLYSSLMWLGKHLMAAENVQSVRTILLQSSPFSLLIIFIGLGIMVYNQHLTRKKYAELRERHAGQGSVPPSGDPS